MQKKSGPKPFTENRKATHEYETLEKFEGGLALTGAEVKSIREGGAKLQGAYVLIQKNELWLIGADIRPYSKAATREAYDPIRHRKILVHKKELAYLAEKTAEKGLTLIPFSLYSTRHQVKLGFGLCRGRKAHDKREKLKRQDLDRRIRRASSYDDV